MVPFFNAIWLPDSPTIWILDKWMRSCFLMFWSSVTNIRYACSVFVTSVVHWDSKRQYTLYLFSVFYSKSYLLRSTCTNCSRIKNETRTCIRVAVPFLFPSWVRTASSWVQTVRTDPAKTLYVFFRKPISQPRPKVTFLQLPRLKKRQFLKEKTDAVGSWTPD